MRWLLLDYQGNSSSLKETRHKLVNLLRPGGDFEINGGRCELNLEYLQPAVLKLEQ